MFGSLCEAVRASLSDTTVTVISYIREKRILFLFLLTFCTGILGSGAQVGLEKTVALTTTRYGSSSMARQQENTLGFKSTQSILGN